MSRKPDFLNVKRHLQWVENSIQDMLKDNNKYPGGLSLPPAYEQNLKELSLVTRAILKKHALKGTHKDIYVERNSA